MSFLSYWSVWRGYLGDIWLFDNPTSSNSDTSLAVGKRPGSLRSAVFRLLRSSHSSLLLQWRIIAEDSGLRSYIVFLCGESNEDIRRNKDQSIITARSVARRFLCRPSWGTSSLQAGKAQNVVTLKIEEICSSEMLVLLTRATRRHMPQDNIISPKGCFHVLFAQIIFDLHFGFSIILT